MSTHLKFHKQLRSERARFYLADFHVHSPASAEIRFPPLFNGLSEETKTLLSAVPESSATDKVKYESLVFDAYPCSNFFTSVIAQRDTVLSLPEAEKGDDWAVIAITDHNVCKYACDLASHAWANLAENRLIILPGIELSVRYPVPPGDEIAMAHLLCIFAPKTSESDIRLAITSASYTNWNFGQELNVQSLPSFVGSLRHHTDYPSICIAAHIGSGPGVQNATRRAILSRLDAAISRVKGEIETGEDPDIEELNDRLEQLKHEREGADQISIEILSLIGRCGFDALQVRGRQDEVHYRRLHRFRIDYGRAVPIVCSDAHKVEDIFVSENGIPNIKLSGLSASLEPNRVFEAISNALRLGETRFSYVAPDRPSYWISGLKITPDATNAASFWPFSAKNGQIDSFILPLSRNLNCLIGGRGSGKSAALEAISFLARESDFNGFQRIHDDDLPDYYSRAKATIKGCKLTMCWQFGKYEHAQHLPKRAVFISRYFDPDARHEAIAYSNADDIELLPEQVPDCTIQYYRLGEIEQQAGPKRLRALFDEICGKNIQSSEQKIEKIIKKLATQRKEIVELSRKINELTKDGTPLREYVQRKRLFEEVDVPEVREAYEEVDRTTTAQNLSDKAIDDWSSLTDELDLSGFSEDVSEFFKDVSNSCIDDNGKIKLYHQEIANISRAHPPENEEEVATPSMKVFNAIDLLDTELKDVAQGFEKAKNDIAGRGKAARDALAAKGLPAGGKDREAKKKALDDATKALKGYRLLTVQWDKLNRDRKSFVKELMDECQLRTNLRQDTATRITTQLRQDLDSAVLIIEADAQPQRDKRDFWNWLDTHFSLQTFKYRKPRMLSLIAHGLTPSTLRELLLQEGTRDHILLQVDGDRAELGAIDEPIAKMLTDHCIGRRRLDCEVEESSVKATFWNKLPEEIRQGLFIFPTDEKDSKRLKVNEVLKLDEIVFDDIPVIRLNDRPNDPLSKPRPVESLSPGQRCSAILPILLLTGSSPIIIDQPEDNMDNRLIRQVIVNILSSIKLRRQVILATHNPNLPVLGDVEQGIILQGIGEDECKIRAIGDLDSSDFVHHLTEVMEGGREAFQYRQTIYQSHWPGPVSEESEP